MDRKYEEGSKSRRPATDKDSGTPPPPISLPKGGGAIRGIGEKFAANPVTGTASLSVPIPTSPGRAGFGPSLALSYDSGAGNGPFGLGWNLSPPAVTRKTDRGLPRYRDAEESDVFLISGSDDLVPVRGEGGVPIEEQRDGYRIRRYRPRIEGSFSRIERWTLMESGDVHWRSISPTNVTTIYGKSLESRIFDPADDTHVFSWLACETYDDKGNAAVYEYAPENSDGAATPEIHERNRTDASRAANRYLKRVRYGNRVSRLVQHDLSVAEWLFEVVFDYGEDHYRELSSPEDAEQLIQVSETAGSAWQARPDPFSSYRSGFEIRTYRRCQRVLVFHCFDELGNEPCLVRSLEFDYVDLDYSAPVDVDTEIAHKGSTRFASFIRSVTQSGYLEKAGEPAVESNGATYRTYQRKSLPPLELDYTQAIVQDEVRDVSAESIANLPIGLDEVIHQWVDLDGEGLSGLLTAQGGAWYYKRNLSAAPLEDGGESVARLGPLEQVATLPLPATPSSNRHFMDLDLDGQLEAVDLGRSAPGYFERSGENWEPHRSFDSLPNLSWTDPNLRFVDLTGDGHADVLVTEDEVFTWYASMGEQGFAAAEKLHHAMDEEEGPRVVFDDGTQSIYLADMSGDGLMDVVRVRNGEVCYWPNLGYGRFGAKVAMDNAPWLDIPDQFDQRRIRLADIDGSGVVDIIYLHRDGVRLYFNQAGNRWSDARPLPVFPRLSDVSRVVPVDLLGNGTACLVWSSSLPADASRPMRYLRLMLEKPHLLSRVVNNLGAETSIQHAPSTRFYLEDKAAGTPWATKLPFPVHVVESVETIDYVSRTRFSTRYAYHHGYFDGVEREFRGFALVEQLDTEAYEDYVAGVTRIEGGQELAPELYQPPVLTRTWFHTGAFLDGDRILHQLQDGYYLKQPYLAEADLPAGLDAEEMRECLRALKGSPLRSEIYSFDSSPEEEIPYQVTESRYEVRLLQHRQADSHAVFLPIGRESISLQYERNAADPRIAHNLNLELGPYGNVLKSASVVYGRRIADAALPADVTSDQQRTFITYTEIDYTEDIEQAAPLAVYRLRVPYESRSYEITGVAPADEFFTAAEITAQIAGTAGIPYEEMADAMTPQRRLLVHGRSLFLDDDLNLLPLGEWDTLGLPGQSFRLALTPGVTDAHYAGKLGDADYSSAGYVHFNGDANWWIPSGTALYPANPEEHFYIPSGARDPFGIETLATLDSYDLLIERVQVQQALWNEVIASNDYRVLGPVLTTDANKNRAAVEVDALGMVVKSAVMGKEGSTDGDSLADPTVAMEYSLFEWMESGKPNFVHVMAREQHGPANTAWRESYVYSNGAGGVAMVKAQAHPGKALQVDADGNAVEVDADPRWIGNGRTILNNKGKPVKQYEPYFSVTHEYEDEEALSHLGVTPVLYYDPLGRNVRVENPNGTMTRVEFTPWMQRVFDANDTVTDSQWYADRGSPDPATEVEPSADPERRAAWVSAKHDNTPGVLHLDSLGRAVYAISDYGGGKTATTRSVLDLTGRFSKLYDQLGRETASAFVNMVGMPVRAESAEKGERWAFANILGAPVCAWDEHGRSLRVEYDSLHRPLSLFVIDGGLPEVLFTHLVYGDRHPDALQLNLLGAVHLLFDQVGMVRVPEFDFKGLPGRAERLLALDYKNTIDWTQVALAADYAGIQPAADPQLETGEVFSSAALYDALNRPTRVTLPDATVLLPTYNEAGFLASLQAQIHGQGAFVDFLLEQDYDAKGQRQYAHYGNDLITQYFYDPDTFRLTQLLTYPSGADPETRALQDLRYTYDPVGNITGIVDEAQQTYYFNNAVVKPEGLYEYDALYQLLRASGREHAGGVNDSIRTSGDVDIVPQLPHANDAAAVRTYTEEYEYDLLGNIKRLEHRYKSQSGAGTGWTSRYRYLYEDDPADRTNRLGSTSLPGDPEAGPYTATYDYDAYGDMSLMPHLAHIDWNLMDQMQRVDLGGGGTAYYVYGSGGQRMRKVIDQIGTLQLEWIFLGPVMIHRRRRRGADTLEFERWTVHVSDNAGNIAQVDTKTVDTEGFDPANPLDTPLIRYQYTNHLGSAVLETDENGDVISYEEYHPYGTTAYRSAKPGFDLSLKRFRFSGKERDDETGLYYFGARYYAAWLGRWTSSDPTGFIDGLNLHRYCRNNPIILKDPSGTGVIISDKPEDIKQAQLDPNRGQTYETWVRGQVVLINDVPSRVQGGTLSWINQGGREHWAIVGGDWVPVESGEEASEQTAESTTPPGQGSQAAQSEPVVPPEGLAGSGASAVTTNPEGPTLVVPDNFDDEKVGAYRERITSDRGVGIRGEPPGGGSRTADIRARSQGMRDTFEAGLPGGSRPSGTDIDHTVELQHIIRGNATGGADQVRAQDHRVQESSLNRSQGSRGMHENRRQIAAGAVEDVPAGGVARASEAGRFYHRPGFRTAVRGAGYALMVAGPALTAWGASQIDYAPVRYGGYGAAAVEAGGVGTYMYGRFALQGAAGFEAGTALMSVGGRIALGAGGAAQALISGYMAVEDARSGDWTAFGFDAAAAVGGVALIAAAVVTAPAWAIGLAVVGIATGVAAGIFHLGRAFGWWKR